MYTNRKSCTVYERTVHNRTPTYVRHVLGAVYYEECFGQKGGTDRCPDNHALLVIPEKSITYLPKPDDRIVVGAIMAEQPPATAMTVTVVKNFRHGSASVQHIEVIAK